ncbi:hypothetical protein CHH60_24445 [Paenibacillus sp. 7523-1]|nr:hypothetical protein CHH60_24445 [Paenibacillus sp. 7523-1]
MKAAIISSNGDMKDWAYFRYLFLSIISVLTFQKSIKVEEMKQRASEMYKTGYHLRTNCRS